MNDRFNLQYDYDDWVEEPSDQPNRRGMHCGCPTQCLTLAEHNRKVDAKFITALNAEEPYSVWLAKLRGEV